MSSFSAEFIEHKGQRILRLDYTQVAPSEFTSALVKAMCVISAEPLLSVRVLTIPTMSLDRLMAAAISTYARDKAKYVLAEGLVGADSFHKVLFLGNSARHGLEREIFDDESQAKDWLATR